MVSRPAGLSTTTTASSSNRILIRSITSMLHQINRPALHFLENHSNVDAEDALKDHRNCTRKREDQHKGTPAPHEPLPGLAEPEKCDISKPEYSTGNKDGAVPQ